MKSTWFKNRSQFEFAKCLSDAGRGYHHNYDLFNAFLECTSIAFTQAIRAGSGQAPCPADEERYLRTINRYKEPMKFAESLALLVNALEEEPTDFLGGVFESLSLNDKDFKGQVFTPFAISRMMADMIFTDEQPTGRHIFNRLTIAEPACGGGSMVIALFEILKKRGFTPDQFFIIASDVDYKCVQMCYIQCTLLGIPALIEHRNTLSREAWRKFPTLAAIQYPLYENQEYINIA